MSTSLAGGVVNRRYQLVEGLGEGAEAAVYLAEDRVLGRPVVLKALRRGDAAAESRLRWEFAALSGLAHPGLVPVLDLDRVRAAGPLPVGQLFFTSQHVQGRPAAAALGAMAPAPRARRLLSLLAEVGAALDALHRRGLVHHDVKPGNLIIDGEGRCRLIDLGLAGGRGGAARGTVAYLAPEGFAGGGDPRLDLYALGATVFHLWHGAPPFGDGSVAEIARAVLQASVPPPLPGAPTSLARLVGRLLALDPAARLQSARLLVDDARRAGACLDGTLVPPDGPGPLVEPAFVGRGAALAALVESIDQARRGPGARPLLVVGPEGSGRRRLIREAIRRSALRAVAAGGGGLAVHGPTLEGALRTLAIAPPSAGDPEAGSALVVAAIGDALTATPALLWLDDDGEPLVGPLVAAAGAGALGGSLLLLTCGDGAPALALAGPEARRLDLGPLDAGAVGALVASMRDDLEGPFAEAVARAAAGLPGLAVGLVRAAAEGRRAPTVEAVAAAHDRPLVEQLRGRLEELPSALRGPLEALGILDGGGPETVAAVVGLDRAAATAALVEAQRRGWVVEAAGQGEPRLALPTAAHGEALLAPLSPARRRALHRRALAVVGDDPAARLPHLEGLGQAAAAAAAAREAGEAALGRGELGRAAALLRRGLAQGRGLPAASRDGLRRRLGEALVAAGDYPGAVAALEGLVDGTANLVGARALQRAGRAAEAEARVRRALADGGPLDEVTAAALRGLLGRLLVARGDLDGAAAACGPPWPPGVAANPVLEAAGLAALYRGELAAASSSFVEAEARARAAADAVLLGRALSLRGLVAQQRDEHDLAAAAYEEALEAARRGHDLHGAAIYAQNLGTVLRERDEYARALAATEAALVDLARLGKRGERAAALFNLGNLRLSVGDLDGAERALGEAGRLDGGDGRLAASLASLEGDLALRRGHPAAAARCFAAAERSARERGDRATGDAALLGRLESLIALRRWDEARELLRLHDSGIEDGLGDGCALLAVLGGLAVAAPPRPPEVDRLVAVAARAAGRGRRRFAFRCELAVARAAVAAAEVDLATAAIRRATRLWEELRMRTPDVYRDRLDEEAEAQRLRELVAAARSAAPAAPVSPIADEPRLRRLVAINKRLAAELRLGPLLELILDSVIELTGAERGFVLLTRRGPAGEPVTDGAAGLEIKVARNLDQQSLGTAERSLSRSIAERAMGEGGPVVTVDAAGDARFEGARSVADLRLRSVLAVPLHVRGRAVGCLYVDHRLRPSAFGPSDVALVVDFADQAAIAVENAHLLQENQRQRRELAALAGRLEKEVATQRAELGALQAELATSRDVLRVRYDYKNLVGRTPRMLDLFRLLDRVTDTSLPVVIYGESGTGKELVARALHVNGRRASRPFVSESCAAIPETLLEAALFGHVRGAFTGADSDRRGLFEIADGGTLFLDEVGEMPLPMQAKLLRVLQEGEFRRLGGERPRQVDVRLLVASNRDLGQLVAAGRFRQDLFYRLNVVRVELPPLRERRDDIPLLVDHFLRKQAGPEQTPRRISRGALACLVAYRWPGNVRELENEVLRAAALGGDPIAAEDLSPHVAAGEGAEALDPDSLDLHARVEGLERTLLREALRRADGNQSQAARLLGLSRFGLQKKLRRYDLGG